jgi:hypothetical protein
MDSKEVHVSRVVFASDGRYYMNADTEASPASGRITPVPGATPRDSFGRELDEPTIDDESLANGAT